MSNTLRLSWSLLLWAEVIRLFDQFNLCCSREQTVQRGRVGLVDGVGKEHYLKLISTRNQ